MALEQDLLQAIRDSPDDDGPRLVYADWLLEQENPQGELIQIQCQLEQLPAEDVPAELRERESFLLQEVIGELPEDWEPVRWAPLEHGWVRHPSWGRFQFQRGLLSTAVMDAVALEHHGSKVFQQLPALNRLSLHCGWSDQLPSLDRALQKLPELVQVLELELSLPFGRGLSSLYETLALHPAIPALRHLKLELRAESARPGLGDEAFAALASGLSQLQWRSLEVWHHGLTAAGIVPLVERRASLRTLDLTVNALGEEGATLLGGWRGLHDVENLRLMGNKIGDVGLRGLGPALTRLRRADLRQNRLKSDLASLASEHLESLDLGSNSLTPEGVESLLGTHRPRLRDLSLRHCRLGDDGCIALARSPGCAELEFLNLRSNQIGRRGFEALASSPYLTKLKRLNLNNNEMDAESRKILRESETLQGATLYKSGRRRSRKTDR
jgi:uncharacterized protein (TIGR02996 family)